MLFSEEFVDSLREDPVRWTIAACDKLIDEIRKSASMDWSRHEFDLLMEAYALIVEVAEAQLLPVTLDFPEVTGSFSDDTCKVVYNYIEFVKRTCESQQSQTRLESLRNRFRVGLTRSFAYEFSQGDLDRIQVLVNQLRSSIAETRGFEPEHQRRLLRRLERLQTELHKKVSDLDRFWGLIGDAGVVLGKLGDDAKPIVDRIREIADIVWRTQSRAEELPSGTKLPELEDHSEPQDEA